MQPTLPADPEIEQEIEAVLSTLERAEARFKDLSRHVNLLNAAAAPLVMKKPDEAGKEKPDV